MADAFDPYYFWLSIPPRLQPANHYHLLGLQPFEDHPEVISAAADRQMSYLRTFQSGKQGALSQRVLNEIAAARICLLNPNKKAEYDERLRSGTVDDEPELLDEVDGAAFGEYLLIDHLGSGWMGQLFKAQHRTMGRVVALKILSHEATKSPELVARFRTKVNILARLKHENLVAAFDAGERDGTHYLIMEYVDGWDLSQLLKEFGTLPVEHVVDYMIQAASGLSCAHENGVFHRNIKPSNILVDRQGIVKVIGLGVARFAHDSTLADSNEADGLAEDQGRIIGTIDFMAPEQALNSSAADQRSDIYGLGCTMFSLLAKRTLYAGRTNEEKIQLHRSAPIPSLTAIRGDVPPALDAVVQRMVAKRPEQRYQSMKEVVAALKAAAKAPAVPQAVAVPAGQPVPTAGPSPIAGVGDSQDLAGFLGQLAQNPTWKKRR